MPKAGGNTRILKDHYQENIYTMNTACDFLGLSKRTIGTYVEKGILKGFLFRSVRFFKESELREFLDDELSKIY